MFSFISNSDVREAAGVALGKTGNGQLMYMILRKLLGSGDCNKQISALRKMSSLGIMTVHFLAPLLQCLVSNNNAVTLNAINACRIMKLNDGAILNALLTLINSDRPCKLKVYTIRALGCIGCKAVLIRDILLDTLHFHPDPLLRKEACSVITKLGFQDDEIVGVLQDLVFIDDDHSVRCEAGIALNSMGLEAVGDMNLTEAIQRSIKELGCRENIMAYILKESENELEGCLSEKKSPISEKQSQTDNDDVDTEYDVGNADGNKNIDDGDNET